MATGADIVKIIIGMLKIVMVADGLMNILHRVVTG
jgi:hypothetical protein